MPIYSSMAEWKKKMLSLCMRSRCFKVSPIYMGKVSSIVTLNPIVSHFLSKRIQDTNPQIFYLVPTRRSNLSISELPKSSLKATRLSPVRKSLPVRKLLEPMLLLVSLVIWLVRPCTWLLRLSRMRNLVDLEVRIFGHLGVVYSRLSLGGNHGAIWTMSGTSFLILILN